MLFQCACLLLEFNVSLSPGLFSLGWEGLFIWRTKSKESVSGPLFLISSTHGLLAYIFFLWSNQVKDDSLGINNVNEQLRNSCVYCDWVWSESRCWLLLLTRSNAKHSSEVQHGSGSRGAARTFFLAASLLLCLYFSFLWGHCMWLSSPPPSPPSPPQAVFVPGQGLVPSTHNTRLLPCLSCYSSVRWISTSADAFPCP